MPRYALTIRLLIGLLWKQINPGSKILVALNINNLKFTEWTIHKNGIYYTLAL